MKNCPYCGMPLKKTTWDRLYCSNCGVISEETEVDENKERGYIQ